MSQANSLKVVMLGDSGVGKTSLVRRQCSGEFSFQMTATVGTAHCATTIDLSDGPVDLKIWDTAGQERFAALIPMYTRGADACIIVGSICSVQSLDNLHEWHERIISTGETPMIIAAINKMDMSVGAPLSIDEITSRYGADFPEMMFVSAKTGDGVAGLFTAVALSVKPKTGDATTTDLTEDGKGRCC